MVDQLLLEIRPLLLDVLREAFFELAFEPPRHRNSPPYISPGQRIPRELARTTDAMFHAVDVQGSLILYPIEENTLVGFMLSDPAHIITGFAAPIEGLGFGPS
jgi:hypothetical protein